MAKPFYGLGSGNVSFMKVKMVFIVKYVTHTKECIDGVLSTYWENENRHVTSEFPMSLTDCTPSFLA